MLRHYSEEIEFSVINPKWSKIFTYYEVSYFFSQ